MKAVACLLMIFPCVFAKGAVIFVVAPNSLEQANGNTAYWPFTFEEFGIASRRFQQVYDASQFGQIGSQGGHITHLLFREGQAGGPGDTSEFLPSVEINLGITSRAPDGLSPEFSENIGAVYTSVYNSSLEVWTGGMGSPWTFVTLDQPFYYSAAEGNLLLDIRTFASGGPPNPIDDLPALNAEEAMGDSISSVTANDVNALSGLVNTRGLVTGFLFEPIPEPSTWTLLGLGLVGIWRFSRRRSE